MEAQAKSAAVSIYDANLFTFPYLLIISPFLQKNKVPNAKSVKDASACNSANDGDGS